MLIRIYHYQQDPAGIRSAADALRDLLAAGFPAG
jgi:hypothetical protein